MCILRVLPEKTPLKYGAGTGWGRMANSNNSRYTAAEQGNVFHRRNVLLFPIVQIQSDRG